MITIQLPQGVWRYDSAKQLGPDGGFGAVFAGVSADNSPVAIKQLHIRASEAAHRELRIADELAGRSLPHVVPIIDSGQDAESDRYFVVMARAEKSLAQEVSARGPLPEKESALILRDIALGLEEVHELVHRDLKPGNVLYHDGLWKLADFGIARFVEESTSEHTLKGSLTWQYAAPEQWNLERAVAATDIYALGCIGYALLTGSPPFQGNTREDYRRQHLHDRPPTLPDSLSPELRTFLSQTLRKPADARISRARVLIKLNEIIEGYSKNSPSVGLSSLANAGLEAENRAAQREAEIKRIRDEEKKRDALAEFAFKGLQSIVDDFAEILMAKAAIQKPYHTERYHLLNLTFEDATLAVWCLNYAHPVPKQAFEKHGWDVIAGAAIAVQQYRRKKYIWAANLWYTDLGKQDGFRWVEVGYFTIPGQYAPFALTDIELADKINHPDKSATIQVATHPRPIDDEDFDEFCDRWAAIFAKAHQGELSFPPSLPID